MLAHELAGRKAVETFCPGIGTRDVSLEVSGQDCVISGCDQCRHQPISLFQSYLGSDVLHHAQHEASPFRARFDCGPRSDPDDLAVAPYNTARKPQIASPKICGFGHCDTRGKIVGMVEAPSVLIEGQIDLASSGVEHHRHLSRHRNGAAVEVYRVGTETSNLLSPE